MRDRLAGCFTVEDSTLVRLLALVHELEGLRIEPSAAAGFVGPGLLAQAGPAHTGCTHIVWTTGGKRLPEPEFQLLLAQGRTEISAP